MSGDQLSQTIPPSSAQPSALNIEETGKYTLTIYLTLGQFPYTGKYAILKL